MSPFAPRWSATLAALLVLLLAGCAGTRVNQAPVEERGSSVGRLPPPSATPVPVPAPGTTTVTPVTVPGSTTTAPVPAGYYLVKSGDTLVRIALDHGQSWREVARWNNLENPNRIEVGQILRVTPPVVLAPTPVASGGVVTQPITQSSVTPVVIAPGATASTPVAQTSTPPAPARVPAPVGATTAPVPVTSPAPVATVPAAATSGITPAPVASAPAGGEDELSWNWPSAGPVLAPFDETRNKGVDLGGNAGDAVLAAADGRVVYVGAGLRGYGNLIILKHNNTYLTAYAHNQALLVKEDQTVHRGQKIAEMGSSDADRVKLHFELRRQGKPVDPQRYLPGR